MVESAAALLLPGQVEVDADLLRLASGEPQEASLHPAALSVDGAGLLDTGLMELEVRLIQDAMAGSGGNQSEAARRLGISRVGLIKKLARLGLR